MLGPFINDFTHEGRIWLAFNIKAFVDLKAHFFLLSRWVHNFWFDKGNFLYQTPTTKNLLRFKSFILPHPPLSRTKKRAQKEPTQQDKNFNCKIPLSSTKHTQTFAPRLFQNSRGAIDIVIPRGIRTRVLRWLQSVERLHVALDNTANTAS